MADLRGSNPIKFNSVRRDGVVERRVGVSEKVAEKGVLGKDDYNRNLGGLGCLIEEELGKVSLEGASGCSVPIVASKNDENVGGGSVNRGGADVSGAGGVAVVVGNEVKMDDNGGDEGESEEESEGESSSSSSSWSSSDEEEEDRDTIEMSGERKTLHKHSDVEDGEILSDADNMVVWGDHQDADDDDGGGSLPVVSKNEVVDLPPVPSLSVTLEPHHQMFPVGNILSIIGPQVIVEGVEKHAPLDEGSILWITENKSPLGIIDEIFGPVKCPYYIVRYNSETEIPPGIQQGTLISCVQEFANRILNDRNLYQKGYDASGENDEELSVEVEFSDDEEEAEYKRMLKMKKRDTNESNPGNKRKEKRQLKNQKGNWNKNQDPAMQDQHLGPSVGSSLNQDNNPSSSGFGQGSAGDQAVVPPFMQMSQAPGFLAPNGLWSNGLSLHQQQSVNLPTGVPADAIMWMQHNLQLYQNQLQTNAAFQQQIGTVPGSSLNSNVMGGQPNLGGLPMLAPWSKGLDQNALKSLQFGMGLQAQQASLAQHGMNQNVLNSLMGLQAQQASLPQNDLDQNVLKLLQLGMVLQAQQALLAHNGLDQNALKSLQLGAGLQAQQGLLAQSGLDQNVLNSLFGLQAQQVSLAQNGLDHQNASKSLQFAMGLQAQQASLTQNEAGEQAGQSQGSETSHNLQRSPAASNFNEGRGGGGRRGHHRGRFGRGRGRS